MVAGAYVIPGLNVPQTKAVNAELTDELLTSYIAKDTDQDGLPDWQEALYGTSKDNPDSDGDGINDGDAVRRGLLTPTALSSQIPSDPLSEEDIPGEAPAPGSLTDEFSRTFFEAYVKASGGQPMSAEAQEQLLAKLLADFNSRATRQVTSSHTLVSVRTSAIATTHDYAAAVENVLRTNEVDLGGKTPVLLMQDLLEKGDTGAGEKLEEVGKAQANAARELLAVSVPPHLAEEHLALVRSVDSLAKSTTNIASYQTDPLATMGALTAYTPASHGFVNALKQIAVTLLAEGEPAAGTPGAYIIEIARMTETP
jgi:hypothetical protein